MHIRIATVADAPALLKIYTPYVMDTAITFEYEVPSLGEFRERIENTLLRYPYLVAEMDGEIVGYAYAGPFKGRAAYDWVVEATVYVDAKHHGEGGGSALYARLESVLRKQGIRNMYACVSCANLPSETFHEHLGFRTIGRFSQCGYKFKKWYDIIWMEKLIGAHTPEIEQVIPFSELS